MHVAFSKKKEKKKKTASTWTETERQHFLAFILYLTWPEREFIETFSIAFNIVLAENLIRICSGNENETSTMIEGTRTQKLFFFFLFI